MYQHLLLKIYDFTKRKVIFSQTLRNNNNDLGFDALRSLCELRDYACICLGLVGAILVQNQLLGPVAGVKKAPVFFCGGVVFGILKMLPLFTKGQDS